MVRSTFAGFTTAQLALSASQRALDVTGQNISNVNTTGYTRQRLDLASISPTGHSYFQMETDCRVGQGVQMTGIIQIRDPFLDIQYRNQLAKVGTVDAQDSVLSEIGKIFDETDQTAVRAALNDVISQLNNMAKADNANQGASDTLVRSSMEVLINVLREKAVALQGTRDSITTKLEDTDIPNINGYLESIVQLNESIKNSQILGSSALELQDQRNQLIDELATYLPISVSYKDLNLGSGFVVDTLHITFTDKNGVTHTLIDDTEKGNFAVDTTGQPVTIELTDADGTTQTDITDIIGEGVLKGTLDALNKAGAADGSDFRGIGYYEAFLSGFIETFATTLNEHNKAPQLDANGDIVLDGNGDPMMEDRPLFEKIDPNAEWSATNIKISDAWRNGDYGVTTTIKANALGKPGTTDYENVFAIINALSTDAQQIMYNGNKLFEGNMFDAYDSLQNTQAIDKKSTSSILSNRISVMNQIADSKDSVSGVYMDEEVMNLMRYQQSYNAAARLMTTLDEALDTLINNTGVVGR